MEPDRAATTRPTAENDFDNSQVSRLTLDRETAGVLERLARDHRAGSATSASARTTCATWTRGLHAATSCSRTRSRPTTSSARRTPGRPRSATRTRRRPAWSSPTTVKNGKQPRRSTAWARHNHENSVPIPGYGKPGRALAATTRSRAAALDRRPVRAPELGAVAALLVHREEHERRAQGQGRPVGVQAPTTRPSTTTTTSRPARRCPSPATSSRSRGTSRRA